MTRLVVAQLSARSPGSRLARWRVAASALRLITLAAPAVAHAQPSRATADWTAFEQSVAGEMAARGIPGVVVVVANARRVVYANAFGVGDAATRAPLSTATRFQVGSITKTFTALLALQMAARQIVSLDAPIGGALPSLRPALAALTLRDLLQQRSGLRDVPGDDGPDDESQLAAWTSALGDTMRMLPTGAVFSYSNAGYALAGAALESWGKQPFADLLRTHVFAPLGMAASTMRPSEALTGAHATGHVGPPGTAGVPAVDVANDTRLWPSGYAWSSGDDMGRFLIAIVADGRLRAADGLYRGVVDSVLAPGIDVPGLANNAQYGSGVFVDRTADGVRVWHPGGVTGFSALWRAIPASRVAVAILTNRDGVRLDALADEALSNAIGSRPPNARGRAARSAPRPPGDRRRNGAVEATPRRGDARGTDAGTTIPRDAARLIEGTYVGRFPLELRWTNSALHLVRLGDTLRVTALGGDRYRVHPPGEAAPDEFIVVPPRDGRPGFIQMFLWAFVRR